VRRPGHGGSNQAAVVRDCGTQRRQTLVCTNYCSNRLSSGSDIMRIQTQAEEAEYTLHCHCHYRSVDYSFKRTFAKIEVLQSWREETVIAWCLNQFVFFTTYILRQKPDASICLTKVSSRCFPLEGPSRGLLRDCEIFEPSLQALVLMECWAVWGALQQYQAPLKSYQRG